MRDDVKTFGLVLIGLDWVFNNGNMTKFLVNKFTGILQKYYECKKEDILRESQPKCYECVVSETCLTDAAFGC